MFYYSILSSAVPGPISGLTGDATFFTIDLMWSPPANPNGIIVDYNIQYRINESSSVIVDSVAATSNPQNYSIANLPRATLVSDISISASTSVGRGPSTTFSAAFRTLIQPRKNLSINQ